MGQTKKAFSLVEALIFVLMALSLISIVMGLIRAARVQDEFNAEKLDTVVQLTMALEKIRRDACVSDRGAPSEDGKTLSMESRSGSDLPNGGTIQYTWNEKKGSLTRSGEKVSSSKLLAFTATGSPSLVTLGLLAGPATPSVCRSKAPPTQLTAPVLFRKEALRNKFIEWVPDRSE
jgi:hypothetical protein